GCYPTDIAPLLCFLRECPESALTLRRDRPTSGPRHDETWCSGGLSCPQQRSASEGRERSKEHWLRSRCTARSPRKRNRPRECGACGIHRLAGPFPAGSTGTWEQVNL